MTQALKIAVIAGEESGDLLAADLISHMQRESEADIELIGIGGRHLAQLGLKSLIAMEDISLMGISQIVKKLPLLLRHIHYTAAQIVTAQPDCLIVIDAPDFTHRVASRVRKKLPHLPIIQYVAPSVWAWRPERAVQMRRYIDHLLVVLPFEVEALRALNGPPATYVGHPLLFDEALTKAREARKEKNINEANQLVVLPGSRRSELRSLMPLFGETIGLLHQRMPDLNVTLPTLPALADEVRELAQAWPLRPHIITQRDEKAACFAAADAALAASGTVSLELALAQVPMVLCYKADWFAKRFILPKVTIWSAALPNLISDAPIVPEYYNEFIRPALLARQLQRHMVAGSARNAQLAGFASLLEAMQAPLAAQKSREIAARTVFDLIRRKRQEFDQLSDADRPSRHQSDTNFAD